MKWSLRTKMIAIIALAGIFPLILGLVALEVTGYRHLISARGSFYEREASHVALTLQRTLQRDVQNLTSLLNIGQVPALLLEIERSPQPEGVAIQELDNRWLELTPDSPEVAVATQNPLAERLRVFQREHPLFAEIIVADSIGRLVAATGKTSDFDQSDESWWQQAILLPKGAALLEGLHFDKSSRTFSLDIALPVRAAANAPALGVVKVVIRASELFASVPVLSPDFEAEAEIIDRKGQVVLQLADPTFVPNSSSISAQAAHRLNPEKSGWFLAPMNDGDRQMVGFAPFSLFGTYLSNRVISGEPLYVVVSNRASAVLAPLKRQLITLALAGLILVVICTSAGLYLSQRNVIQPLATLRRGTEALAASTVPNGTRSTDLHPSEALAEVGEIHTHDEIEALAHDFTAMAQQLLRHQKNLHDQIDLKTAELQKDLDMARDLQQAFLPRDYPRIPSEGENDPLTLNFHHLYQAAMSVSGDFCDVIKLGDHRAGIFIADVMGHGTRSALVTAILRTLVHSLAREITDPAWFLTHLNQHFHETMKQTDQLIFVTACYVVIDTRERTAWCASAGHPSPLCCNRVSGTTDLFFDSLKNNPALGLIANASYTPFTRRLRRGDVFVLFTDGVIEAMNERDEEFGQTRLLRCTEHFQNQSLSVLTHAIVGAVKQFTGQSQLGDDLCLVAVEAVANQPEAATPNPSRKVDSPFPTEETV